MKFLTIFFRKINKKSEALIFYKFTGSGEYTFLLLHNAGGNHLFFKKQLNFLNKIGRVLVIDLPGHGLSKKSSKISVKAFAKDIHSLCSELSIKNLVGIGLNYGGNILIEMATLFPKLFIAIILIDPPIFLSKKVTSLINNNIDHLMSQPMDSHAKDLVSTSFIKANNALKEIAIEAFSNIDGKYLANIYKELLIWDKNSGEKIKSLSISCLTILTDGALCSISDVLSYNSDIIIGKVVDSMYWATLEVPDQINSMIKRFIDVHCKDYLNISKS